MSTTNTWTANTSMWVCISCGTLYNPNSGPHTCQPVQYTTAPFNIGNWDYQRQVLLEAERKAKEAKRMAAINRRKELVKARNGENAFKGLINGFKLGCDPEFSLVEPKTGLAVEPRAAGFRSPNIHIGEDCGVFVELRPNPAPSAYELCKTLKGLIEHDSLKSVRESGYKFRSGGIVTVKRERYYGTTRECKVSMGGHLHFGRKGLDEWTKMVSSVKMGYASVPYQIPMLNRLTSVLENLDILPREESDQRRRSGGYGNLGDAYRGDRTTSHEYRKMCSWLFRPHIAFLAITLAKLVMAQPAYFKSTVKDKDSYDKLRAFVELFKERDQDAARLMEGILALPLNKVQADPKVDFYPFWEAWTPCKLDTISK